MTSQELGCLLQSVLGHGLIDRTLLFLTVYEVMRHPQWTAFSIWGSMVLCSQRRKTEILEARTYEKMLTTTTHQENAN